MPPTISTVITTYNYARFIAGAIDSVLAQTHPPDEVIVVDDGSTDETGALVARYAAAGVRYIWTPNRGVSAARNQGIRESRGELLAFLDADDRWLPDKLARQVQHLRRYPAAGLITGGEWQVEASPGKPRYIRRPAAGAARMYARLLVENSIGNASLVLIQRACFTRVGEFDETVGLGQDWDMWLRIARAFRIGVIDAPLIQFTRHGGSLTAGKVWERYASNRGFQRRYIGQVRAPLRRLRLLCAAQSMNCYYTAAAFLEAPAARPVALALALAAAVLDPGYQSRLKFGVLLRAACGQAAFARVRRILG